MNEYIDKLPFEIWSIIFEFIDVQELLNFKLISKKFNQLINQLKFKELIIIGRDGYCKNNWYNLEPINLRNAIICDNVNYLDNQSFVNNLIKIKCLKTKLNVEDFGKLNQLTSLEYLELNNYLKFNNDINLILPNLKILILWFEVNEAIITLDTLKLEIIRCTRLNGIKFIHPESIKTIEVNTGGNDDESDTSDDESDTSESDDESDTSESDDEFDTSDEFDNISKFTNLEIFKCYDVFNDKLIYQASKTLKSIHIYSDYIMKAVNCDQEERVSINFVNKIVKDRLKLNRNDLKLYFNGIELIGDRKFNDYGFIYLAGLDDVINYYDQFESRSDWFNYINYSEFIRRFKNQPPSDFFQRFPNIQRAFICRTKEVDQEEVLKFLSNCPLSIIQLFNNPTFDQSFYNRLPDIIPLLRSYHFIQGEGDEIELDYSFIFKFKFLDCFNTSDQLTIEFIIESFRKMKFLYQIGSKGPSIKKMSKKLFCLKDEKIIWNNLKEDELINLYNDLKEKLKSDLYEDRREEVKKRY